LYSTAEIEVILALLNTIIQVYSISTRSKIKRVTEETIELVKLTNSGIIIIGSRRRNVVGIIMTIPDFNHLISLLAYGLGKGNRWIQVDGPGTVPVILIDGIGSFDRQVKGVY